VLDGQMLLAGSVLACRSCASYGSSTSCANAPTDFWTFPFFCTLKCTLFIPKNSRVTSKSRCPGSIAVFDICIAVVGTGLHTVRVIRDRVLDIVVENCDRSTSRCDCGCNTAGTGSCVLRVGMLTVHPEGWSSVRCQVVDC